MIPLALPVRPLVAVPIVLLTATLGAGPVLGHSPDPFFGGALWAQNQVLKFRWQAGEVPPVALQDAIKAAAADSNATRASQAAVFQYDPAGESPIDYGLDVSCGVNGLACMSRANAPRSFTMSFREHGHRFTWGVLRWCQLELVDGCYDARNIALDEFGHVQILDHHGNLADDSDYGDAVVQKLARARPRPFWDMHVYGRCDIATLQLKYDVQNWAAKYSTCLDLVTTLTLSSSTSSIRLGGTVTFTAVLKVADDSAYGRLRINPLNYRTVQLQRRSIGSTTWVTIGSMTAGSGGTYTMVVKPGATYDYRAVFAKPSDEGLRGATSPLVRVTVSP